MKEHLNHRISVIKEEDSRSSRLPPIYLINLNSRDDRLRLCKSRLHDYRGAVYLYKAINTRQADDFAYAQEFDINLINWNNWQRGIGGYGNRMSHIDLLSSLCRSGAYEYFVVMEDDVDVHHSRLMRKLQIAQEAMKKYTADVFLFAGWDFMPKEPIAWSPIPWRSISKCSCTLGTQLNLYSISGAQKFLDLSDRFCGVHLDEAVADLQKNQELTCIGFKRNPFHCFASKSDVEYI